MREQKIVVKGVLQIVLSCVSCSHEDQNITPALHERGCRQAQESPCNEKAKHDVESDCAGARSNQAEGAADRGGEMNQITTQGARHCVMCKSPIDGNKAHYCAACYSVTLKMFKTVRHVVQMAIKAGDLHETTDERKEVTA